jgi:hypothetical protein
MSITYKDVQMLNDAFGNLNQTFQNRRALQYKQAQAQAKQDWNETKEADTQDWRAAQEKSKDTQITDTKTQRALENKIAQDRLDEERRHNKQTETTASDKDKTTLYTPSGERVTVPASAADALKQSYAASNPGKQLSETNPYEKTLTVGGIPLTYHDEKSYNAAVMKQQEQQQAQQAKLQPRTSTRITTGTSGGLPVDETNVTTTATSPGQAPLPSLSGPAQTANNPAPSTPPQISSVNPNDPLGLGITQPKASLPSPSMPPPSTQSVINAPVAFKTAPPPMPSTPSQPTDVDNSKQIEAEDTELKKLNDYVDQLTKENQQSNAANITEANNASLKAAKARLNWLETPPPLRQGAAPPSPLPFGYEWF